MDSLCQLSSSHAMSVPLVMPVWYEPLCSCQTAPALILCLLSACIDRWDSLDVRLDDLGINPALGFRTGLGILSLPGLHRTCLGQLSFPVLRKRTFHIRISVSCGA